ncbi:MAG: 2-C-methyl-D-erythritol 4-phosphate cytidylyltransferase [Flavobacterium sp.]|jgi:2-C-methyl-D-erythritol 4-phosphate cytidylyltransferase
MLSSVVIIVPAAGVGSRMQTSLSKQYLTIAGKPILQHCLEKLLALSPKKIILVVSPEDELWSDIPQSRNCQIVKGGLLRSDSVLNGIQAIEGDANDWIMVHDCVRPCFTYADVINLYQSLESHPVGGLLGIPVFDTLKRVSSENEVLQTLDRNEHYLAQTPQMFRLGLLKKALIQTGTFSDEASAIESLGYHPKVILGSRYNIKVTTQEDLALAEAFLKRNMDQRDKI